MSKTTTTYYLQATTGKLHRVKSCSITRATRYNHFEVELTDEQLSEYVLCARCFDVDVPAPQRSKLEAIEQSAKTLRVAMSHTPRDAEYLPVLSYRIEREIAAAERRIAELRELHDEIDHYERSSHLLDAIASDLDAPAVKTRPFAFEIEPVEPASERVPQVHEFDSTAEAYDASQCVDEIRDGDVLVVRSERAVAIMLSAWPTAVEPGLEGDAFHVPDALDWTRVPAIDPSMPSKSYLRSREIAQPIIDELRGEA